MATPLSSLRNTATFLPFSAVDNSNSLSADSRIWNLSQHTAYIGEIIGNGDSFGIRTMLKLQDPSGTKILLAFHDSNRGLTVARGWKVGQTVLLLYPKRHRFMDGQVGFRIENEQLKNFKIFPYTYKQLLEANDQYFNLINNTSVCSNPACLSKKSTTTTEGSSTTSDAGKTKLLFCARCGVVKYCSKECQGAHWNAKDGQGHKGFCKVLESVKWITKKKWGEIAFDEKTGRVELYDNKE